MDPLIRRIDAAIVSNDDATILEIFSPSSNANGIGSLGLGEQRALCGHLVAMAVKTPNYLPRAFGRLTTVFSSCLSNLPAVVEQAADSTLRLLMFEYLVDEVSEYSKAAHVLGAMRMESEPNSVYYKTPAEKCDVYVKVSECFLLDDDIVEADSAVTLAGTVVEEITDPDQHWALILRYKSTYARVLDCNRKFLPAASRYHDLTNLHSDKIDEGDILELLGRATTCAILAPSGAQKQRILATLYADPRLGQLQTIPHLQTHATLVTKMYRSQVIRPEDVGPFESSLADHQKAIRGDGRTILQHAILEHNMIAVSRLYRSIYLRELNKVLGDVPAEKLAATMITDGSLKGKIDQVEGILYFSLDEDTEDQWNKGIMSFCTELNRVASNIHDAAFFD